MSAEYNDAVLGRRDSDMPKGPVGHHSRYIHCVFSLQPHSCFGNCACVAVGCTQHWQWRNALPSRRDVDTELHLWGAYQGPVTGKTKQERFLDNYDNVVRWVRELDGTTIFCNWDSKTVADVFGKLKTVFAGHTVPTTKALYFFVPDLFIILDRKRVWTKWRSECSFLPRRIDDVSGNDYTALLEHVKIKILSAIKGGKAFTLDGSSPVTVGSVDALRLVNPLQLNMPRKIGHTLGKAIDNIIS